MAYRQRGRAELESAVLRTELTSDELTASGDANVRHGAFRVGVHDDLVTAVGLAVQDLSAMRAALCSPQRAACIARS
jgi:hypothetical protein